MFDGAQFPKSLDESDFEAWLEKGRESQISYRFLVILWDTFTNEYKPMFAEDFDTFREYEPYGQSFDRESLIAVYDLFSESRIQLTN